MLRISDFPNLAELTSLHLGGRALALFEFDALSDLDILARRLETSGGMIKSLGGGTNILAAEGTLPYFLVSCAFVRTPEVVAAQDSEVFVRVAAGMRLPRLLAWCARQGLSGLEGMTGVPGTVGGAIAGNAGAHGMDMGTVLHAVQVFSPGQGLHLLERSAVQCAYRFFAPYCKEAAASFAEPWYVITGAVLRLRRAPKTTIRDQMRALMARKICVQPVRAWSAGCLFRNPLPDESPFPAGKLLDEAGFRGKRLGGMCLSPFHANFLVNEGQGSSAAALELVHEAQEGVLARYGILLHPEVKLWAC